MGLSSYDKATLRRLRTQLLDRARNLDFRINNSWPSLGRDARNIEDARVMAISWKDWKRCRPT